MSEYTVLSKADLDRLDYEAEKEIAAQLGKLPTLADVQKEAATTLGQRMLSSAVDLIQGMGRVITLLAAELLQAFAALGLMVVFAFLENERLWAGALALGQSAAQAQLIALAFVVGNTVTPIYELRNLRGKAAITRTRATVRGYLEVFTRRIFARPQTYQVDVYDNPTLPVAAAVITWATLALAFYAVLGPVLHEYSGIPWHVTLRVIFTDSDATRLLQITGGALVSIGGVFFLQSASHEIGVRTLTDLPPRPTDDLRQRQEAYRVAANTIRENVRARAMTAKLADKQRRDDAARPTLAASQSIPAGVGVRPVNGNGHSTPGNPI